MSSERLRGAAFDERFKIFEVFTLPEIYHRNRLDVFQAKKTEKYEFVVRTLFLWPICLSAIDRNKFIALSRLDFFKSAYECRF